MRSKILRELMDHSDTFVSGQKLCKTFGVSRQAVWKNICCLKELGYDIESVTNKGYRLISKPDILYGPEIEAYLEEESFCQKVECHDSIDSTNIRGKQLAELGEAEGTLIVADRQTAGRGRRGRNWISESGVGIYMTYVLRPTVQPAHVSGITLLAALAMCEATYQECDVLPQIKWPNDVIIDGKKICGILTEAVSDFESGRIDTVVVGIGINYHAPKEGYPDEIKEIAGTVCAEDEKIPRNELVAAIIENLCKLYQDLPDKSFMEDYRKWSNVLGKKIRFTSGTDWEYGTAVAIDEDGGLIVEKEDHTQEILRTGEITVRVC